MEAKWGREGADGRDGGSMRKGGERVGKGGTEEGGRGDRWRQGGGGRGLPHEEGWGEEGYGEQGIEWARGRE